MCWWMGALCFPVDRRSPTGWNSEDMRNGSAGRSRRHRRIGRGNGSRSQDQRWRELQGEVRLLRSGEVCLQGQAWLEPGGRQRDLVDEERAGVDVEVPAALTQYLPEEGDAHLGRRPVEGRLRQHLLLPEVHREAGQDLGG